MQRRRIRSIGDRRQADLGRRSVLSGLPQFDFEHEHDGILWSRRSLLFLDTKLEGNNRIHSVAFQRFFSLRGSSPRGNDAPGPRSARPTGSTALSASGKLRRKVGMVEMIRLADESWAPVAQGHPGA
jgi:hypothetical protein